MSKKMKVTQIRSVIGCLDGQKRTIRALGLGKINKTVIHDDTPCIRGMVNTVKHIVKVEDIVGE
jgi:large subunit ribosomal protein L30